MILFIEKKIRFTYTHNHVNGCQAREDDKSERVVSSQKTLNNNVVIAVNPVYGETVLIGKGIGFQKKTGTVIDEKTVEKCFILLDRKEQEQYKQLLTQVDEELVEVINEAVNHIQKRFDAPVSEHIHVALMDHIGFAIRRMKQGLTFHNPFLIEIQTLYEKEYQVAEEIVQLIHQRLGVRLPDAEIGFIAMHIHSALTRWHLAEFQQFSGFLAGNGLCRLLRLCRHFCSGWFSFSSGHPFRNRLINCPFWRRLRIRHYPHFSLV
ncbi:PRD domain-containing protein [Thermoactinomyces mirandus]|uniref:Transcription antiterminator n=1 Tax=Thermoactinomyces mirandus TaxID=2756294 RepID=A0A7W2APE5_9BACL|nr:transcription antiterminator [Thermoactinomyces mirandus]MBA4600874.1 transcription antiterminator [Thermoactinomyces mirandus]